MSAEREAALVAALQRGDRAAFDEVYAEYRPRLFGFLLRMTRRPEVAEELLQETWFRLADKAWRLRPDTRLGPWLFTVARNLARSHQRWSLLGRERLQFLAAAPPLGNVTPFEMAAAGELERTLEEALAALPPNYREVLLLVGNQGLTPAEAAVVVGVQPEALRQRLARARRMVGDYLEERQRRFPAPRDKEVSPCPGPLKTR